MTDKVNINALKDRAKHGWSDDCLIPKTIVKLICDELEAARATAEQRDSVIEECAKVCEKIADLLKTGSVATAVETAEGCASEIRALKSQRSKKR